jgi:hypothetical protein
VSQFARIIYAKSQHASAIAITSATPIIAMGPIKHSKTTRRRLDRRNIAIFAEVIQRHNAIEATAFQIDHFA